jgi:uncharacterized protein (DUF433 family)
MAELIKNYPNISQEDVLAALAFARGCYADKTIC